MSIRKTVEFIWLGLIFSCSPYPAAAEDFTNTIHAYLHQRVEAEKIKVGIVAGLVDEHGSRVVSCGKLDNPP